MNNSDYKHREKRLSVREATKMYNKLMHEVKTNDYYKRDDEEKINCYVCSCGRVTKTISIDVGVTPFMCSCVCGNIARSTFFKDVVPDQSVNVEFYRPTLKEFLKLRKNQDLLEHVTKGGLLSRNVPFDLKFYKDWISEKLNK